MAADNELSWQTLTAELINEQEKRPHPPAAEESPERKAGLDFSIVSKYRGQLFGVSIILIMIFHYFCGVLELHEKQDTLYKISYFYVKIVGSIGVEIFLFLSGMGLYFSYTKNSNTNEFYKKRFTRILIPYLMYAPIVWLIKDCIINGKPFTKWFYDLSLASFWLSGNRHIWFIGAICLFYALFPLLYAVVTSKHYRLGSAILTGFFLLTLFCAYTEVKKKYEISEIGFSRIVIFFIGIYMGRMIYEKRKIQAWHIITFSGIFAAKALLALLQIKNKFSIVPGSVKTVINVFGSSFGSRMAAAVFSLGYIFVIILILSLLKCKWLDKFLIKVGSISLELYMCHVTTNGIITAEGSLDINEPLVYAMSMSIAVVLAIILHISSNAVIKRITTKQQKG